MKLIITIFIIVSAGIVYGNSIQDTVSTVQDSSTVVYQDTCVNCTVLDSATGIASYYGARHQGKRTACGEVFDMHQLSASHNKYPFGTIIRVTNLSNKQSVILKVTDRLNKKNKRLIDISQKAAEVLGMIRAGIQKVKVEVLKWGVGDLSIVMRLLQSKTPSQ
jgi:rare lipoprotein A